MYFYSKLCDHIVAGGEFWAYRGP